ncbi:MAG: NTP transferase domain-containing protein [Rhodospirillaceae bacterium]|jgi:mannose-1-phosphate guanylyltransferase|nr:NTP transferase domain-containing protein [Rhodospirillaceae bacterium]
MASDASACDGSNLADIDVVVLAGGLGTRLRGVLPDRPKILAPIGDEPYIAFLLDWLAHEGASRIVFSLGFRADQVQSYLAANPPVGLHVETVVESAPAGTAGALRFVAPLLSSDPVLVMNGDSFIDADLSEFAQAHHDSDCGVTILCVELPDVSRFGRVEIDDRNRITRFAEKDPTRTGAGLINAGVYLFNRKVLDDIVRGDARSLERDVFASVGDIGAHVVSGTFLDIGTPESLAAAESILRPYRRRSAP